MSSARTASAALAAHRDQVVATVAAAGGTHVRVFGSVARGQDGEDSDVDLLVTLPDGIDLFELVALEQRLEDLLGVPVDIIDDRSRGAVFQRALREAVAL